MKNEKYEYVQRIPSYYVSDDCVQDMVPHFSDTITILNSDGMTYHYKPNSNLYVNKYNSDERKEQFPYSQIPTHQSKFKGRKVEFVNQLFEFNRIYIEIADNLIKERYVVKDGNEALLVTKIITPNKYTQYMNREEVEELLKTANGGIYSRDGGKHQSSHLLSDADLLEWYKEGLIEAIKIGDNIQAYNGRGFYEMIKWRQVDKRGYSFAKYLPNYFRKCIDKITVDDVPSDIVMMDDSILVSIEGEIKSIKDITVKFISANNFKVEISDFPITIYSLDHIKQLEQTNFRNTTEPRIPRRLNSKIDKEEVKKEKNKVLSLKKDNKRKDGLKH